MRNAAVVVASSLSLLVGFALAGTNGLDATFGSGGVVLLGPTPASALVAAGINGLAVQPDGKILFASRTFKTDDPGAGASLAAIGRLNADGSWDTSFADHGLYVLPFGTSAAANGGELHEVLVLSDGSIVGAGGSFVSINTHDFNTCTLLLKLDGSGNPDATFGPGGSFCFDFAPDTTQDYWFRHFEGIAADSDDSLFVTTVRTNLGHGAIAHFDSNGALIQGWGTAGIAALPAGIPSGLLEVRADHKLMVTSARNVSITPYEWKLATLRLDSVGQIDAQYGAQGEFDVSVDNAGLVDPVTAVLHDGKMLVGSYTDSNPFTLYQLDQAGGSDPGFNNAGQQPGFAGVAQLPVSGDSTNDYLVAALPLADGHAFAFGAVGISPARLALIRLNADSGFDANFGDAQHPGWTTINVGGLAGSDNYAQTAELDVEGHALLSFRTNDDGTGHGCSGLIRVVPDRLFDGQFDPAPPLPTCPQ